MIMSPWTADTAVCTPTPTTWTARVRRALAAVLKYVTNHVICHIPSYTIRHLWYRRVLGWYIGPRASILMGQHVQIGGIRDSGKRVSIGAGTIIHRGCELYTTGGLLIGENVNISPGVWLVTNGLDVDDPGAALVQKPIVIDDRAWIGARATILGGVTVGEGAVVMAGAVVASDVAPYTVVGGVPARTVRSRSARALSYELDYRPLFE